MTEIEAADILNACGRAPKTQIFLGPAFNKDIKKTAIILPALYGLKNDVAVYMCHLMYFMHSAGYGFFLAYTDH